MRIGLYDVVDIGADVAEYQHPPGVGDDGELALESADPKRPSQRVFVRFPCTPDPVDRPRQCAIQRLQKNPPEHGSGLHALLLEAKPLLFGSDERDHSIDIVGGQPLYWLHVAEVPMMLRRAVGDR